MERVCWAPRESGRLETCSAPREGRDVKASLLPTEWEKGGTGGGVSILPLGGEPPHLALSSAPIVAGSPECRWC